MSTPSTSVPTAAESNTIRPLSNAPPILQPNLSIPTAGTGWRLISLLLSFLLRSFHLPANPSTLVALSSSYLLVLSTSFYILSFFCGPPLFLSFWRITRLGRTGLNLDSTPYYVMSSVRLLPTGLVLTGFTPIAGNIRMASGVQSVAAAMEEDSMFSTSCYILGVVEFSSPSSAAH